MYNSTSNPISRKGKTMKIYGNIVIDNNRDKNLTDFGKVTLSSQFCMPYESYQEAFARAADAFSGGDDRLAQRIYDYASNLWFSFATPLLANGGTNKGLPISCFLNYVEDSISGLCNNFTENAFLSVNGGGIGTYWGEVRSMGEKTSRGVETPGIVPFLHVQDAQILAYHQGSTRRGAAAVYLDVSHPEIYEFIKMRASTVGDVHRKNENLHHGVCIPDSFMYKVEEDGTWELIDPESQTVRTTVSARDLWIKILQQRAKLGEPYLFFTDTANRLLPKALKNKGLYVHHSNLCTEITLPTNKDRTAVCCLSSINLAKKDEWWSRREQFVEDLVTMLDNALDVFRRDAPQQMWRAVSSVSSERSIGLGTLGFHTWLQMNNIPMDSIKAREFNISFYSELERLAKKASKKLAWDRGEPEDLKGTGMRNAHLIAIAPNATSSIVCGGVSPSIEPFAANSFTQKTKVGSREVRNPALVKLLEDLGKNTDDIWSSISTADGSVQHLDFLTDHQKLVFRTAEEIGNETLIRLAADRQPYICQAQSLNLFYTGEISPKELHKPHFDAWKLGIKSLYYLRSKSVKSTGIGEFPSSNNNKEQACSLTEGCVSCEG